MQSSINRSRSPADNPLPPKKRKVNERDEEPSSTPASPNASAQDAFVRLNVGGKPYDVARTLFDHPRAGMLQQLVSGGMPPLLDRDGRIHLDGDRKLFRYVLHYLRHNCFPAGLPDHERDMLQVEASFFGVQQLSSDLLLEKVGKELENRPNSVTARLRLADTLYDAGDKPQAWKKLNAAYELLHDGPASELYAAHYDRQLLERPGCPWRLLRHGSLASVTSRLHEFSALSELTLCLKSKALLGRSKWQEALDAAEAGLSQHTDLVDALVQRGHALVGLARSSEALAAFDRAISLRPNDAEAHVGRSSALLGLGHLQQANVAVSRAAQIRPDDPVVRCAAGEWFLRSGQGHAALTNFDRALNLDPNLQSAHAGKGRLYSSARRWREAVDSLDEALKHNPEDASSHFFRGAALNHLGQVNPALDAFGRTLELDPNHEAAHVQRSKLLLLQGRHDEALDAARRAVEISPNSAPAISNLGLLRVSLEQYQEGLRDLDRALQIDPHLPDAVVSRAIVMGRLQINGALAALQHATQLRPESITLRLALGKALVRQGRGHEAVIEFSRVLQAKPDDDRAYRGRAIALQLNGQLPAALTDLSRAAQLVPQDAQLQLARGDLACQMDDFNMARDAYGFALTLDPSARAHLGRARAHHGLSNLNEALADYDKALQLQPDLADAQNGRNRVRQQLTDLSH